MRIGTWHYLSNSERSRPERVTEVPAALLPPKLRPVVSHPTEAMAAPQPLHRPRGAGLFRPLEPGLGSPPALVSAAADARLLRRCKPRRFLPVLGRRPVAAAGPPQIVIRATADSWVQLRDAARSVLLARVLRRRKLRVPDGKGLSMRTGNAGGLEIAVDGNLAPPLGPMGAVRRNVVLDAAGAARRDRGARLSGARSGAALLCRRKRLYGVYVVPTTRELNMSVRPYRDIQRRQSRKIHVGPVPVGGDAPITVQSMTNTVTSDVEATVAQVQAIEEAGADIVRVSCPTRNRRWR